MNGRIYLDFDDVIAETGRGIIEMAQREFQTKVQFDEITNYNLQVSLDMEDDEFERLVQMLHSHELLMNLEPIPDAIQGIRDLKDSGFEMSILTGRPPSTEVVTRQWLERHEVPCDRLMFVDKYSRTISNAHGHGGVTLEELKTMSFDLAIEDSDTMAVFLSEQMNLPVLLHDRPWNRHLDTKGTRIQRCQNWQDMRPHFHALLKN